MIIDVPLRSDNALSKTRHDNESAILEKQCENFLESDNLTNFVDWLENFHKQSCLHNLFCINQKQELL